MQIGLLAASMTYLGLVFLLAWCLDCSRYLSNGLVISGATTRSRSPGDGQPGGWPL